MVGQVADLVSAEMTVRVEDFGFVVKFVVDFVVEMAMKIEGSNFEVVVFYFVVECVGEDTSDMMEDIDNVEVEAKVAAKNSNLVGAEDTFDC